ncbi:MAG: phage tail tube protein, partial [Pseudomonadota bacterium]
DAIQGDLYPGDAVAGLQALSGPMVVPLGLSSIGWHLRGLLGAPVTSGSGDFTHTFQTAPEPPIPLVTHGISHTRIGKHFVQDSLAYSGMEIRAVKNGERARATFNMTGRSEARVGATLDTAPVLYNPDVVPVGFSGQAKVNGSAAAMITTANLSLNSGVEADQETLNGASTAAGMDTGMWQLSGSFDARFQDETWYDRGVNGTSIDLTLAWALSATLSLEITAHDVRVERSGIPIDGRGIISSSFNFRANRPQPGQTLLTAVLKNAVASYGNPS